MSNKDLSKQVTHYRNIFIYLLIGTVLTVLAAKIEFNVPNSMAGALFVGLLIASVKGYLVAANFMHLNSEKEMIYWILILTVAFLVLLLFIPLMWDLNNMGHQSSHGLWDTNTTTYNHSSH